MAILTGDENFLVDFRHFQIGPRLPTANCQLLALEHVFK